MVSDLEIFSTTASLNTVTHEALLKSSNLINKKILCQHKMLSNFLPTTKTKIRPKKISKKKLKKNS